ncbi:hypothetical protein MMC16_003818 [Acarospora aff. strigata]|nr:hypothetical protein [Acarospora aff. strigata]
MASILPVTDNFHSLNTEKPRDRAPMPKPSSIIQGDMSTLKDKILSACSGGDLPKLEALLSTQNTMNNHSALPLQLMLQEAAEKGHVTVVSYLLDSNPAFEINSYLAYHAAWGGVEVYKLLLSRKPEIIKWGFGHYGDAVIVAVKSQNADLLYFLLNNGADPGYSAENSWRYLTFTAVEVAVLQSTEEFTRILVRHGAVLAQTRPLELAAGMGRLSQVRCLLEEGADVNAILDSTTAWANPNHTYGSALHEAVRGGHTETVKYLLEHGADPNQQDAAGETPLVRAQKLNHVEIISMLERQGDSG